MRRLTLTTRQRKQLQTSLRRTHDAALCRRLLALLELGAGQPMGEVARVLGVSRQSLHNWVAVYRETGDPAALVDAARSGRPPRWTRTIERQVQTALAQAPDGWHYQAVNWTVALLRSHLAEHTGQVFAENTIRQRLHQLGYVWKRSRYVLEPDPDREKKTPDPSPIAAIAAAERDPAGGRDRFDAVSTVAVRLVSSRPNAGSAAHRRQRQARRVRGLEHHHRHPVAAGA